MGVTSPADTSVVVPSSRSTTRVPMGLSAVAVPSRCGAPVGSVGSATPMREPMVAQRVVASWASPLAMGSPSALMSPVMRRSRPTRMSASSARAVPRGEAAASWSPSRLRAVASGVGRSSSVMETLTP